MTLEADLPAKTGAGAKSRWHPRENLACERTLSARMRESVHLEHLLRSFMRAKGVFAPVYARIEARYGAIKALLRLY